MTASPGRQVQCAQKLATALIFGAINDLLGYSEEQEEWGLAFHWVFLETETDLTSFEGGCRLLGLDSERLKFLIQCRMDQRNNRLLSDEFERMLSMCERC
jgi:hypothetical protein